MMERTRNPLLFSQSAASAIGRRGRFL